jgi:hypothetical protein
MLILVCLFPSVRLIKGEVRTEIYNTKFLDFTLKFSQFQPFLLTPFL